MSTGRLQFDGLTETGVHVFSGVSADGYDFFATDSTRHVVAYSDISVSSWSRVGIICDGVVVITQAESGVLSIVVTSNKLAIVGV